MSRYLGKYSVELKERKLPEIVNLVIFALKELREIYKMSMKAKVNVKTCLSVFS